jgi:hypothetical protein
MRDIKWGDSFVNLIQACIVGFAVDCRHYGEAALFFTLFVLVAIDRLIKAISDASYNPKNHAG